MAIHVKKYLLDAHLCIKLNEIKCTVNTIGTVLTLKGTVDNNSDDKSNYHLAGTYHMPAIYILI